MPVEKFKVPNNFVNSPIFFDFSIEYTTPFRTLAHQYIYVYICYIYMFMYVMLDISKNVLLSFSFTLIDTGYLLFDFLS